MTSDLILTTNGILMDSKTNSHRVALCWFTQYHLPRLSASDVTEGKASGLANAHSKLISSLKQVDVLQVNCGSVCFVNL